jgi:hypothetical protein
MPIELGFVSNIVLRFVNFDECAINKPNATLELRYGGAQHKFLM